MKEMTQMSSSDTGRRIDLLTLLYSNAEEKVNHSDMFRQRNIERNEK